MLRKCFVGMAAAVVTLPIIAGPSFAQSRPDLSGTWKLNVAKSDFGPVPGPNAQTDVIEQKGDTLKISVSAESDQGKLEYVETLTTDGKEVALPPDSPAVHPAPEVTMQSIAASWDGPTLNVSQKLTYGTDPVTGVSHYTLSADGKTLTVASDYESQQGGASRTFVFDKQDSSMAGGNSGGGATPNAPMGMSASAGASASASASNSAKPNLSGTWVLDNSKSDFGPMPPPSNRTDVIEQNGSSIKFSVQQTNEMGDMSFKLDLVDDGKTVYTWQIMGNDAKSTAHWEGSTLVTQTNTNIQGSDMQIVSRYQLAADGKTLTVNGHVSGAMGEGDTKLVFNKK
jgi:hypothetical protein